MCRDWPIKAACIARDWRLIDRAMLKGMSELALTSCERSRYIEIDRVLFLR
jgi:hypothetical protein